MFINDDIEISSDESDKEDSDEEKLIQKKGRNFLSV